MVDDTRVGGTVLPPRYNPAAELSTIVKSAGQTSVKAVRRAGRLRRTGRDLRAPRPKAAPPRRPPARLRRRRTRRTARHLRPPPCPRPRGPGPGRPVAGEAVGVAGVKAVASPSRSPSPGTPSRAVERTTTSTSRSTRAGAPRRAVLEPGLSIARTLLGIPYVYGGEDPSASTARASPCTSSARRASRSRARPRLQQDAATPVSDPKPGDLVFFGSPAWHVGIYTGNGMMIDSPREEVHLERPLFSGVSGYGRF